MKSKILFVLLIIAMGISIYFTYQRSFAWKNFDIVNSDEESAGDAEAAPSEDEAALGEDTASTTTTEEATSTPAPAGAE